MRIYTAERESGIHYVSIWDTATGKLVTDEIYEWEIVSPLQNHAHSQESDNKEQ